MSSIAGESARRRYQERRQQDRERDAAKRRILAVSSSLRENIDSIDLNIIDGEFLFRCGYPTFEERVKAIRASISCDDFLAIQSAATDLFIDFKVPIQVALDHVRSRAPLRLRGDIEIAASPANPFVDDHSKLKVWSRNWRGADVARRLGCPPSGEDPPGSPRIEFTIHNADGISAAARFSRAKRLTFSQVVRLPDGSHYLETRGPVDAPYVEVLVSHPLPTAAVVARRYDAIVRKQHRWHWLLAQDLAKTKWVAIRTWTIALLMAQCDLNFDQAQYRWCERTGDAPVAWSAHQRQRDHLYSRVPAAERILPVRVSSPFAS